MTFMNSLSLYTVKVNIIPQNECCGSSVFAKFSYFPPLVLICIWQWGFSANFTSMCPGSPKPVFPRSLCWVPSLSQLVNKLIPPITYRQGRAGQGAASPGSSVNQVTDMTPMNPCKFYISSDCWRAFCWAFNSAALSCVCVVGWVCVAATQMGGKILPLEALLVSTQNNDMEHIRKSLLGRNSVFLPTKPNFPHNQS